MAIKNYKNAKAALKAVKKFDIEDKIQFSQPDEDDTNWEVTFSEGEPGNITANLYLDGEPSISLSGATVAIAAKRVIEISLWY